MLVYGDRSRTADPREELAAVLARLDAADALTPGLERHAALVAALIASGELAQGLADAAFEAGGLDAPDPAADAALALTQAIAEAVIESWRSLPFPSPAQRGRCADAPASGRRGQVAEAVQRGTRAPSVTRFARDTSPAARGRVMALAALNLPERVTLKEGEGYAFYALYPETYGEAAAALARGPTAVIGVRSIGTSLGAIVAAALGADRLLTVRPTGHPFSRTLQIDVRLTPAPERRVAVVDEGPGLSGSSFGAALDWTQAGVGIVSRETLAFPSHPGDLGPKASVPHRERWRKLRKPFVSFEEAILPRLPGWVEDLTGPALAPLEDLSGGAWRALRYSSEADWPAVNAAQERRKFLLRSERGDFLLKFAGLGAIGERKLRRAEHLGAAVLTPAPLGLRHGFLVEPWIAPSAERAPRAQVMDGLAPHLMFHVEHFPSEPEDGAALAELLTMMEVNIAEGLGPDHAAALEPWHRAVPELKAQVRRVHTDNRLHPHEWILDPQGRLLKTDALDHAEAHDLIGCQDIAWDVAGGGVEWDLDPDELAALWRAVDGGRGGARRGPAFLRFHQLAYLAFQLGSWSMAADAHAGWPEEHARLAAARERYAEKLRRALEAPA